MVVYHSSPPPLTCFFPIGTPIYANKNVKGRGLLFACFFAYTTSANIVFFSYCCSNRKKHVKGGLLYGCLS